MRKPAFCIWENKDTYKLHGYHAADQRLCLCYIDSTIPLLSKSSSHLLQLTARFVCDLVRNTEDRFSHDAEVPDHIISLVPISEISNL